MAASGSTTARAITAAQATAPRRGGRTFTGSTIGQDIIISRATSGRAAITGRAGAATEVGRAGDLFATLPALITFGHVAPA